MINKAFKSICLLTILSLLFFMPGSLPASAMSSTESVALMKYLISIPTLDLKSMDIPEGINAERVSDIAVQLLERKTDEFIKQLESPETRLKIQSVEIRPDLHGVIVQIEEDQEKTLKLAALDFQVIRLEDEKSLSDCTLGRFQQLEQAIYGYSQILRYQRSWTEEQKASFKQSNPTVYVDTYQSPLESGSKDTSLILNYEDIFGYAAPNTAVEIRFYHNGVVTRRSTTSTDQDGFYYWNYYEHNSYDNCAQYNFYLSPGDMIEVVSGGAKTRTVLQSLLARADPRNDTLYGQALPERAFEIALFVPDANFCTWNMYSYSGSTGSGEFSIPAEHDFMGAANGIMLVRDENQNGTLVSFNAYRMSALPPSSQSRYVYGYFEPEREYTATITRDGIPVKVVNGISDHEGWFYSEFGTIYQSNDHITVDFGGGDILEMDIPPMTIAHNATTNQLFGTIGKNWTAAVKVSRSADGFFPHACQDEAACLTAVGDSATGDYLVNTGDFDLQSGDYYYFYAYDPNQNFIQYTNGIYVPGLMVQGGHTRLSGYWYHRGALINIDIRDTSNTLVWNTTLNLATNSFRFSFSPAIIVLPGYTVTFSEGGETLSTTIADYSTARLNSQTNQFTGNVPDTGFLKVYSTPVDQPYPEQYCYTPGSGEQNIAIDADIIGGDSADLYLYDANGNGTSISRRAYYSAMNYGSEYIDILTEQPGASVTMDLWRGGSLLNTVSGVSNDVDGSMHVGLYPSGYPVAGDQIHVVTGDGVDNWYTVPAGLTVGFQGSWLTGTSIPNEYVWAYFNVLTEQVYSYYSSVFTRADGTGAFRAALPKIRINCVSADQSSSCAWAALQYRDVRGNSIRYDMPRPSGVSADEYENDDTIADARDVFSVRGLHTLHHGDIDYAYFDVSAQDVGRRYILQTALTGAGLDTFLTLYDSDGTTILASDDDSGLGNASKIEFVPTHAGRYFLLVQPYGPEYTEYCGAYYTLMVMPVRTKVFLPLIYR